MSRKASPMMKVDCVRHMAGKGLNSLCGYRSCAERAVSNISEVNCATCRLLYKPACSSCNDTHKMRGKAEWMCSYCPKPCRDCASNNGNGPFCLKTPCSCSCHFRIGWTEKTELPSPELVAKALEEYATWVSFHAQAKTLKELAQQIRKKLL